MPWQGAYSGASHRDVAKTCRIVCRLHVLLREQVWKSRRAFHFSIHFRSRDVARSFYICQRHQGMCAQLASAWDSNRVYEGVLKLAGLDG